MINHRHPDYHRRDLLRDPAWRYQLVLQLLDGEGGDRRRSAWRDDAAVGRFFKFVRRQRQVLQVVRQRPSAVTGRPSVVEEPRDFFAKWAPEIYALKIYADRFSDAGTVIEARILAGQTDQQIASYLHAPPDELDVQIVARYAEMFFHVRDRLQAADYIQQAVLAPVDSRSAGASPQQTAWRRLIKSVGYYAGPEALDQLLAGWPPERPKAAEVASWTERSTVQLAGRQALAATAGDQLTAAQLATLQRIASASLQRAGADAPHPLEVVVEEVLTNIPWKLSRRFQRERSAHEQVAYGGPVDPTVEESMHLGRHGVLPTSFFERLQKCSLATPVMPIAAPPVEDANHES